MPVGLHAAPDADQVSRGDGAAGAAASSEADARGLDGQQRCGLGHRWCDRSDGVRKAGGRLILLYRQRSPTGDERALAAISIRPRRALWLPWASPVLHPTSTTAPIRGRGAGPTYGGVGRHYRKRSVADSRRRAALASGVRSYWTPRTTATGTPWVLRFTISAAPAASSAVAMMETRSR